VHPVLMFHVLMLMKIIAMAVVMLITLEKHAKFRERGTLLQINAKFLASYASVSLK